MASRAFWRNLLLVSGFPAVIGCTGLTVEVTATPSQPAPGAPVTYEVNLSNDTNCPTDFAAVFFAGFDPDLDSDPIEECRILMDCDTIGCAEQAFAQMSGGTSPLMQRMQQALEATATSRMATLSGPPVGCMVDADASGAFGQCFFPPLPPGGSGSESVILPAAPDTGNTDALQFAIAFGTTTGTDCSPGVEIDPGEFIVGGCFPFQLEPTEAVPALSPVAGSGALLLLLALGLRSLYTRRR